MSRNFEEKANLLLTKYQITARDLYENPPQNEAAELLEHAIASKYNVLPLTKKDSRIWVAMSDPLNHDVITVLRDVTGLFIEPVFSSESQIKYFINHLYGSSQIESFASQFLVDENIRRNEYKLDAELKQQLQSAPTVKLVDSLIESAVLNKASDIHIEPYEHTLRARFRIDGSLTNPQNIKKTMLPNVISRLKIMGGMNIAEKRLPQDGSFSLEILGEPVDFRLSTLPTFYGEKAVIRLLYNKNKIISTENLGFFTDDLIAINRLFSYPYGAVIITGPTGSGKTTTLTGFMSELNKIGVNITTVEDPVENPIEGINHVAADAKTGMDFPRALRHIIRQDPDIIMIGEIRDGETASIAMRAAITGHLMLTTLHTNDAPGVFPRLVDMGIEPYMVSAALNGIIAQRLVRRLCGSCKKESRLSRAEADLLNTAAGTKAFIPIGCAKCNNSGYKGRFAIYEYIAFDDDIRRRIADCRYEMSKVETILRKNMRCMAENGAKNIELSNTSADEVIKAVFRG